MKQKRNLITHLLARSYSTLIALLLTVLLAGCFPNPDADDEGHATFAREAIPVLLGRRPLGVDEVEVVADIAELLGRDVAVGMLMKDEAYVDHWTDIIVDLLEVQRQNQGGIGVAADSTCWGPPTRPRPDPSIAEWVRDHDPNDPVPPSRQPAWNMTDLVRSAIAIDDLSPIYRANLFTTTLRRAGLEAPDDDRVNFRNTEMTNYLLRVYLNRDTGCLGCHNPERSTSNKTDTNGNIVWRRLWNIPGHPEKALFGNYNSGATAFNNITPIMRADVRRPAGPGFGIRPWGMATSCMQDTDTDLPQNNGTLTHEGFASTPSGGNLNNAFFGSLDGSANGRLSVWNLEEALANGIIDLQDGYERTQPTSANHPAGSDEAEYCGFVEAVRDKCITCHRPGGSASFLDMSGNNPGQEVIDENVVDPGNLNGSTLWNRINGGGMPPASQPQLTNGQRTAIQDWISGGAPVPGDISICEASTVPDVEPDEAFAFLTASNLVDGIWESVMGYPLTIDHGFPRNDKQMHMLWNLTESQFIKNDWSLKSVLSKVMTSNWYARRAPNLSQEGTAYELPPVLDPWVVADPTVVANPPAHQKNNGQGEMVDMYRVNTVLRNISAALGWKKPDRFPPASLNTVDYPYPLDTELGQFLSPALPGFDGINFQSLLALESRIGSGGICDKNGRSEDSDDWIDLLVNAINSHNSANPHAPITLGSAWSMVKDRLVQDTTIETRLPSGLNNVNGAKTESEAVVDYFRQGVNNALTINSSTGELSAAQLQQKLRGACSILIKSSFFLMSDITPRGYSDNNMPDPPELAVCLPGESCSYPSACGKWRRTLQGMGHQTICEDRTIRKGVLFFVPGVLDRFGTLRPKGVFELDPKFREPKPWLKDLIEASERASLVPSTDLSTLVTPSADVAVTGTLLESRPGAAVIGTPEIRSEVTSRDLSSSTVTLERAPGTTLTLDREVLGTVLDQRVKVPGQVKVSPEVIEARPPLIDLEKQPLNLVEQLKVVDVAKGEEVSLKGVNRIRQRLTSLCLDGLCSFQTRSNLQQCLARRPKAGACNRLRSVCDPRCTEGENCCGTRAVDASDSGVMTIWAEGATVKTAEGVRILPFGQNRWRRLRAGTKLNAGDLLDVPLKSSLAIQSGKVVFGDSAIDEIDNATQQHMISVTGPSASKVVSALVKKNTLHPGVVAAGTRSGQYLSKGFDRKEWLRVLRTQTQPIHKYELSDKEVLEKLSDYEAQHEGMGKTDQ